jgi:hypothetical protein
MYLTRLEADVQVLQPVAVPLRHGSLRRRHDLDGLPNRPGDLHLRPLALHHHQVKRPGAPI